jgi:hypothetical protein
MESLGKTFMFLVNFNAVPWNKETEIAPIIEKMKIFMGTPTH